MHIYTKNFIVPTHGFLKVYDYDIYDIDDSIPNIKWRAIIIQIFIFFLFNLISRNYSYLCYKWWSWIVKTEFGGLVTNYIYLL